MWLVRPGPKAHITHYECYLLFYTHTHQHKSQPAAEDDLRWTSTRTIREATGSLTPSWQLTPTNS